LKPVKSKALAKRISVEGGTSARSAMTATVSKATLLVLSST